MATRIVNGKEATGNRNLIKVWRPSDISRIELQRGYSVYRPVPRHWHDEYQFCLIEDGKGDLSYRGSDILTPPASLFIVHPGEVHSNRAFETIGCSFRTIFLEPELMRSVIGELGVNEKGIPFFPSPVVFDADTVGKFTRLHTALEEQASSLERATRLREFIAALVTRYAENRFSPGSYRGSRNSVKRALDYLAENYAENIPLEKLAALANLSPFHFNRIFAEQFGMPPHAFQVQIRLAETKKLLRNGASIAQAAAQTGFSDQSHLTRHFRQVFGFTPGQYK